MNGITSQRAQASAELVAVVPLTLLVVLALGQLVTAGWALVSAGEAARSGARAAHVGAPPGPAVRRTVQPVFGPAGVGADGAQVRVRLSAPSLVPGLPSIPVAASAALDPAANP